MLAAEVGAGDKRPGRAHPVALPWCGGGCAHTRQVPGKSHWVSLIKVDESHFNLKSLFSSMGLYRVANEPAVS